MSWSKLECPECGSNKVGSFLEFKGKNAKIQCGDCPNIWWTDI